MKNIALFDIDGTIANIDHRLHYLRRETINWNEFEEQSEYDLPIPATVAMLRALSQSGVQIWLWTGRTSHVEAMTKVWLERHSIPYHQLLMRPEGTFLNASTLKKRWLHDAVPKERVICAFEDEVKVVEMLTSEGLVVFQVKRPEPENEE
jgi:uncharacterized HAD superfamily protein